MPAIEARLAPSPSAQGTVFDGAAGDAGSHSDSSASGEDFASLMQASLDSQRPQPCGKDAARNGKTPLTNITLPSPAPVSSTPGKKSESLPADGQAASQKADSEKTSGTGAEEKNSPDVSILPVVVDVSAPLPIFLAAPFFIATSLASSPSPQPKAPPSGAPTDAQGLTAVLGNSSSPSATSPLPPTRRGPLSTRPQMVWGSQPANATVKADGQPVDQTKETRLNGEPAKTFTPAVPLNGEAKTTLPTLANLKSLTTTYGLNASPESENNESAGLNAAPTPESLTGLAKEVSAAPVKAKLFDAGVQPLSAKSGQMPTANAAAQVKTSDSLPEKLSQTPELLPKSIKPSLELSAKTAQVAESEKALGKPLAPAALEALQIPADKLFAASAPVEDRSPESSTLEPATAKAVAVEMTAADIKDSVTEGPGKVPDPAATPQRVENLNLKSWDSDAAVSLKQAAAADGTGVAITGLSMKNQQKMNKVAGLDVKVLPVEQNGGARGKNLPVQMPVTVVRTAGNAGADLNFAFANGNDQAPAVENNAILTALDLPSLTDTKMRALERTHDMVALHAMRLVESKSDVLSVVIKPAIGTEISLELRQHSGGVEAQATLTRGDHQFLNQHWPELQHRLELRGIKLAPLAGETSFSGNENSQYRQQHTTQEEAAERASAFAEFAAVGNFGGATARLAMVHDGWESWA